MREDCIFQIGNIVKINTTLMYTGDWALQDKPGEVIKIDTGKKYTRYLVQFGCDCMDRRSPRLKNRRGWFRAKELELESGTWEPVARASFLFGDMGWHHLACFNEPFDNTCPCMHLAHDGEEPPPATRRIQVNIWGTVQEVDVCAEHADYDGRRMDDFPYGERWRRKRSAS